MATLIKALLLALPALLVGALAGAQTAHTIAGGSYAAMAPADWDGETDLHLLVAFHGYGASGAQMLRNEAFTGLAAAHGYLLVAPDGLASRRGPTTWSHQGSPSQLRDEFAFLDAVLADVAARYPLADTVPVFTGFSQGASMVWDIACTRGGTFGRYVAIGAGFWDPMPERCTTPVGRFVHVHGLDDPVVPLEGRPIGDRWHQGDIFQGLERFKTAAGCSRTPDILDATGALHCRTWSNCKAGRPTFCLHPGGHAFDLSALAAELAR